MAIDQGGAPFVTRKNERVRFRAGLLLLLVFAVSCARRLDVSSIESFEKSKERMRGRLTEARRKEFDEAVSTIGEDPMIAFKVAYPENFQSTTEEQKAFLSRLRHKIHEKTADEVIAIGREIELAELRHLKQLMKSKAEERDLLKKLNIVATATVTRGSKKHGLCFISLEVKVTNHLDKPITAFDAIPRVIIRGRSVAEWEGNPEHVSIEGGLEPGETKTEEMVLHDPLGLNQCSSSVADLLKRKPEAVPVFEVTGIGGPKGFLAHRGNETMDTYIGARYEHLKEKYSSEN